MTTDGNRCSQMSHQPDWTPISESIMAACNNSVTLIVVDFRFAFMRYRSSLHRPAPQAKVAVLADTATQGSARERLYAAAFLCLTAFYTLAIAAH
jgi:hypothetical protein